jgi:hypothetical protein
MREVPLLDFDPGYVLPGLESMPTLLAILGFILKQQQQ